MATPDRTVIPVGKYPFQHKGYFPEKVPKSRFQHMDLVMSLDGVHRVARYSTLPELQQPVVGLLFIFPGLNECVQRNGIVAEIFAKNGFASFGIDYMGFGNSEGLPGDMRDFGEAARECERFIVEKIEEYPPGLPVFVFGQSLGGMMSLQIAMDLGDRITGILLINPAIKSDAWWFLQKISGFIGYWLPWLPVVKFADFDTSSDNLAVAAAADVDPEHYHGKLRAGTGAALVREMNYIQSNLHRIHQPFSIIQGLRDFVVKPDGARMLYDTCATDATHKEKHELAEEWHDLVHSMDHQRIINILVDFAKKYTKK